MNLVPERSTPIPSVYPQKTVPAARQAGAPAKTTSPRESTFRKEGPSRRFPRTRQHRAPKPITRATPRGTVIKLAASFRKPFANARSPAQRLADSRESKRVAQSSGCHTAADVEPGFFSCGRGLSRLYSNLREKLIVLRRQNQFARALARSPVHFDRLLFLSRAIERLPSGQIQSP